MVSIVVVLIVLVLKTNLWYNIIHYQMIKDSKEYYGKVIKFSDFPKDKILEESYMDKVNKSISSGDIGNSAETALVPLVFDKKTLILYTAKRLNKESEEKYQTDKKMHIIEYLTNIKTFYDVTWLKEAHPDYAEAIPNSIGQPIWSFDPYVKFFQTR